MKKNKSNPKKGFWLLTVFFGLIIVSALCLVWGTPVASSGAESAMGNQMGNSMGLMMRDQHGSFTLTDLFKSAESSTMMSMQGHHQGDTLKSKVHFVTTATIFLLMPWIFGGIICLFVLWQ